MAANEPAFPAYEYGHSGLTKREYFAAHILAGICADPNVGLNDHGGVSPTYAKMAVAFADALITELAK